ncbi:hypothetical protein L1887_36786 [Cichorium endivia]|nr:hypothetical protein L1887_36786 [Cichorium endivia]
MASAAAPVRSTSNPWKPESICSLYWADMVATFSVYVLMNYFTDVWKLNTTHAADIINIWDELIPTLAIMRPLGAVADDDFIRLDILLPKDKEGPKSVVIVVTRGAWMIGNFPRGTINNMVEDGTISNMD